MNKIDVISHFGTVTKAANALGLTKSAISQWPDKIPRLRAFEIERITNGKLKVDITLSRELKGQPEKLSCAH